MAACLATRFNVSTSVINRIIPNNHPVVLYGRVQLKDTGETIQGRYLVPLGSDSRDSSFLRVNLPFVKPSDAHDFFSQYELLVDQVAHLPRQPPNFKPQNFYGQLLCAVVLNVPPSARLDLDAPTTLILAVIHLVTITHIRDNVAYYTNMGPVEAVDLTVVQCLVGRVHVRDRNEWAIVDRSGSEARCVFTD